MGGWYDDEMLRVLKIWGVVAAVALVACGGDKPEAKDPSDAKPVSDETPKWEGAATPSQSPESSKPSSPGGARPVNEQGPRRTDQYDKEGTEVALKRAARQVKDNCGQAKDENGKATGPWGKTTLQVMLGSNGHSKSVTVPPPFTDKPSGKCIEKAFTNLQFPPWSGADTEVAWEVEVVEPKSK